MSEAKQTPPGANRRGSGKAVNGGESIDKGVGAEALAPVVIDRNAHPDEWASWALTGCRLAEHFDKVEGQTTTERMLLVVYFVEFFEGVDGTAETRKYTQLAQQYRRQLKLPRRSLRDKARTFLAVCDLRRLARESSQ